MFELICKYKVGHIIHGTVIKAPCEDDENTEITALIQHLFLKIGETKFINGENDCKILEISIKRIKE